MEDCNTNVDAECNSERITRILNNNYEKQVVDEIALEGLDGITIDALWIRLSVSLNLPLPFDEKSQNMFWNIIQTIDDLQFYELQTPRAKLILFNRFDHTDDELGLCKESSLEPEDIYPYNCINDVKKGNVGSSMNYYNRKRVTKIIKNMSLHQSLERYGSKLVVVASQKTRNYVLFQGKVCGDLQLTPVQFCILERIGRSREHGEITQGKNSLNVIHDDAKNLFYYRKVLLKHKLIKKQQHQQKINNQNVSGNLFHLTRFYNQRKTKAFLLIEELVQTLKAQPGFRMEYEEVRKHFPHTLMPCFKKLYRNPDFQKFVRPDVQRLYRELYPNATINEWKVRASDAEKRVRTLELIDENVDVNAVWFAEDQDDNAETEESGQCSTTLYKPLLNQAVDFIIRSGTDGISQAELRNGLGYTHLSVRALAKNVMKKNICDCVMVDMGRQRTNKFCYRAASTSESSTLCLRKLEIENKRLINSDCGETLPMNSNRYGKRNFVKREVADGASTAKKTNGSSNPSWFKEETDLDTLLENFPNLQCKLSDIYKVECNDGSELLRSNQTNTTNKRTFDEATLVPVESELPVNEVITDDVVVGVNIVEKEQELEINELAKRIRLDNDAETEQDVNATKDFVEIKDYVISYKLEDFFGDNPQAYGNSNETDDMYKITVIVSTVVKIKSLNNFYKSVTHRMLLRAKTIFNVIQQEKVITDMLKVEKLIYQSEKIEGYNVKIHKKSVFRLVSKLIKDGYLQAMKVIIIYESNKMVSTIFCDVNVDVNHSKVLSAIEGIKTKFLIANKRFANDADGRNRVQEDDNADAQEPVFLKTDNSFKYVLNKSIHKNYGFVPKFIRSHLIHSFIYFLVYEYSNTEMVQKLSEDIDTSQLNDLPPVYKGDSLTWHTFVPPLPQYEDYPPGWTMVYDIIIRLPVSLFTQICHVSYEIHGLKEFLNHPVKKYYLVKDLSPYLMNGLLRDRKYVYHVHDCLIRMCYMGLLQFGPQKLKTKDHTYIYINRQTTLYNTIESKPGYHKIESRTYPKVEFNFNCNDDVDNYWYELWNICMGTRLGHRSACSETYIIVEKPQFKPLLQNCLKVRTAQDVLDNVDAELPGDHLGAAGLDSSLFSHLKRNWQWSDVKHVNRTNNPKNYPVIGQRKSHLDNIQPKVVKLRELHKKSMNSHKLQNLQRKNVSASNNSNTIIRVRPLSQLTKKSKTVLVKNDRSEIKRKNYVYYDEVDKRSLLLMRKLRVDWSSAEDKVLLFCKLATMYLYPLPKKRIIPFSVYRDVLHAVDKHAANKTSRACQRRIHYMLKKHQTSHSVEIWVDEIKRQSFIRENFEWINLKMLNGEDMPDDLLHAAFIYLVHYLINHFPKVQEPNNLNVDRLRSDLEMYRKGRGELTAVKKKEINYNADPMNDNDIERCIIKSIVHSALCSVGDKTGWAYHYFKVYEKYSEEMLRSVMLQLQKEQLVSLKKTYVKKMQGRHIPLQTTPYQLSCIYIYALKTSVTYDNLIKTNIFLNKINNVIVNSNAESDSLEINRSNIGTSIAMSELFYFEGLRFEIEIPTDILKVDPKIRNKDSTYERIAKRYVDIVKNRPDIFGNQLEELLKIEQQFNDMVNKKITKDTIGATGRIAMYLQRGELSEELEGASSQHLHDYFTINPANVFLKVKKQDGNNLFEQIEVSNKIKCESLLQVIKQQVYVDTNSRNEDQITESLLNIGESDSLPIVTLIINYIQTVGSVGASGQQLKKVVQHQNICDVKLKKLLDVLMKLNIIIRLGIVTCTYVHRDFADIWLIDTFKLTRLEKEKIDIKKILKPNDNSGVSADLESHTRQIRISPWIHIDGTVNRTVLERWLSSILNYCLLHPGTTLHSIALRFKYLTPFEILLLAEYLEYLNCIKLYKIVRSKVTLFSKNAVIEKASITGLEDSKEIVIETLPKATLFLSLFIGCKGYGKEFNLRPQFKKNSQVIKI